MTELNIAICGCREYNDKNVFIKFVDNCLAEINKGHKVIILSGHCSGVDAMAEDYAKSNGYEIQLYPAEWARYGKGAGPKRNLQMANDADAVIAFWDGHSRGTKNMIDTAEKLNKRVYVKKI